jgi:hypothetical protein
VSFEVFIHPTNISGQYDGQMLINDTTGVITAFANSSADNIIINLKYFSDISGMTLDTDVPLIISLIPVTGTIKAGDLSWNLTFDPNQTGVFLINITFSLNNYEDALFIFHLTINKAQTTIYNSLPSDPTIYYDESLDFFLLYNNTDYNENITGLTEGTGITLNNTNIEFINVGSYATNITYEHSYFESSFIIVSFEILARLTDITGEYDGQALINDTTMVTRYFANSSADSITINLAYSDVLNTNILDTSAPTIIAFIPTIGAVKVGDLSWNLTFDPNQTGIFLINITFSLSNYEDALFIFHLTINKAQTAIYNSLPINPELPYSSSIDFYLIYNNTDYNENITGLTEISGITLNNTKVSFLNHTESYYWFRLSPTPLTLGFHATNITFEHVYFESRSKIVIFNVFNRSLIIDNSLSIPASGQTINLQYGEIFLFNVIINDSETKIPLNSSTISLPVNVRSLGISNDGNHSFTYNASQIGQFVNLTILFTLENYESITYTISFSISPSVTNFGGGTSPINGSMLGEEKSFYYTESRRITIQWEEKLYGSGIIDLDPEFMGNWQGFITFEEFFDNGTHIFRINGSKLGLYQLSIVFETENYSKALFFLRFNISIMPTFQPEVNYQSELIVGQILTITVENWLTTNNNSVLFGDIRIKNGSSPLFYVTNSPHDFPFILQLSTEDLGQGSYNLTLIVTSIYGYENQSLSILFELIGREILITIKRTPEKLVQGEDFVLIAILNYAIPESKLGGIGAEIKLDSLEGIPVTFLVEILYANGTIKPLPLYITVTNETGIAKFLVNSVYTHEAEAIKRITITTGSTASAKASSHTTPDNYIDNSKFEKQVSEDPLQLFYLFILIIFFISMTGAAVRWNSKRSNQSDSKEQSIEAVSAEIKREEPIKKEESVKEEETVQKDELVKKEERVQEKTKWIDIFPSTFSEYELEIRFLFKLVVERFGPYNGQTSLKYLLSHSPPILSNTNLKLIFNDIAVYTDFFIRRRNSIVLTDEGKRIASIILQIDNQE